MANGINRRRLLVGGGAGIGLVVAWSLWPRDYAPNLVANPGETAFGAWLKIGSEGRVTVAVPQAEHGQGVWTALPQIVADELGADWRTVGVEPAPLNPLYANPLGLNALFEGGLARLPGAGAPMLTGGSSSIRMFETSCAEAGAAARALLCMAAARRWDVDWKQVRVDAGFCTHDGRRIRFAEIAEPASRETIPDPLPMGEQGAGQLSGKSLPRLDVPAKVDGSANFAGDVRLADMVHAAIRQGPPGSRLVRVDRAAADRIRGVLHVVENPHWVAAIATTGWAAQQALDALAPRFESGRLPDSASIDAALDAAFDAPPARMAQGGDLDAVFKTGRPVAAIYRVGLGVHASLETRSATAAYRDGRLELWLATQAPGLARAAAARAADLSEDAVVVHPMPIGGSFGAALEHDVAQQAAVLAVMLKRPVSLVWSRGEETLHDRYRPPAVARMAARLGANGAILGWHARIAAPTTGAEMARRLMPGLATEAALKLAGKGDRYAVGGALPAYRLPAYAIDHHVAEIGISTGHLRGGAHGLSAFFTECFLDELAAIAGSEPMSYRIGMLGGDARLARCLSTAASLGGWNGGVAGSGQGIAAHAFRGSYIAVLAEAEMGADGRPRVDRLVAAVDCGAQINPDIVRQQVEGGLILGMGLALGCSTGVTRGLADARGFGDLGVPRLADTPDITIELIRSEEAPGGVSELGVPAVAPAIANALHAATGYRIRNLPLRPTS